MHAKADAEAEAEAEADAAEVVAGAAGKAKAKVLNPKAEAHVLSFSQVLCRRLLCGGRLICRLWGRTSADKQLL